MRRFACTWLVVAALGCGESDGLKRHSVSGSVTVDGKPLENGLITFVPKGFEGPPVGGPIKDGAYSIRSQDGPVAGEHSVSVYSPIPSGKKVADGNDPKVLVDELFESIPAKYNDKTELKADVGKSRSFDFTLTGRLSAPARP